MGGSSGGNKRLLQHLDLVAQHILAQSISEVGGYGDPYPHIRRDGSIQYGDPGMAAEGPPAQKNSIIPPRVDPKGEFGGFFTPPIGRKDPIAPYGEPTYTDPFLPGQLMPGSHNIRDTSKKRPRPQPKKSRET